MGPSKFNHSILIVLVILLNVLSTANCKGVTMELEKRLLSESDGLLGDDESSYKTKLTNYHDFQYYGKLGFGEYKEKIQWISVTFDTGSSWLWAPSTSCSSCAGGATFSTAKADSYKDLNSPEYLNYGKGSASGTLSSVNVYINDDAYVKNQEFILVNSEADMSGQQASGLLGLSWKAGSSGNPTLVDNLKSQNVISSRIFTVHLSQTWNTDNKSYLTFGEASTEYTTEPFEYLPLLTGSQYSAWYVVKMEGMTIGNTTINAMPAVLDTGTSYIILPTKSYNTLVSALPNNPTSGFVDCGLEGFKDLTITLGTRTYTLKPEEYVIYLPDSDMCVLAISPSDQLSFSLGDIAILGDTFLRRVDTVYDMDNYKAGLATNNNEHPSIPNRLKPWQIILIVLGCLLFIALVVGACVRYRKRTQQKRGLVFDNRTQLLASSASRSTWNAGQAITFDQNNNATASGGVPSLNGGSISGGAGAVNIGAGSINGGDPGSINDPDATSYTVQVKPQTKSKDLELSETKNP